VCKVKNILNLKVVAKASQSGRRETDLKWGFSGVFTTIDLA